MTCQIGIFICDCKGQISDRIDTSRVAAKAAALPALAKGTTEPLRYASRVNPNRCIKCRTCETICPHGAIRMTEQGAVSDPALSG